LLLIIGFTDPGWFLRNGDRQTLTPFSYAAAGRIDVRLDDDHDRRVRCCLGIVGELSDSARQQDADIRLGTPEVSRCDRFANLFCQSVIGERHVEDDHLRRPAQPLHVPLVEERPAVIRAERLVNALAVEKPVVENGNRRIALAADAPVDVDRGCHRRESAYPL
jgi:hypothetical protein